MSFWCHCFDQKTNKNIVSISALKVFIASLELPGSFFELPVALLINDITNSPGSPQKLPESPQEATKNFRAEISLAFWKKFLDQKDILKLTDL